MIDRPITTVTTKLNRKNAFEDKNHPSAKERWLDVEFQVEQAIAGLLSQDYPGDSFPVYCLNVGPELTSSLLGCELQYMDDNTGWSIPNIHSPEDWSKICIENCNFDNNPYWQAMEQMTDLAIEMSQEQFIVGMTDLHGNYDILAGLRDPQHLCMDLMDCPDQVIEAGKTSRQVMIKAFNRNYTKVVDARFPASCWIGFLHDGPAYVPSCDFWCMVSPQYAHDHILPDIVEELTPLERSIFPLDGLDALPHLDILLQLPQLNAIQWVYGDGHGCASDWINVYRKIQSAGKSIQMIAQDVSDALNTLGHLKPEGIWIKVLKPFDNVTEVERFTKEVERMCIKNIS